MVDFKSALKGMRKPALALSEDIRLSKRAMTMKDISEAASFAHSHLYAGMVDAETLDWAKLFGEIFGPQLIEGLTIFTAWFQGDRAGVTTPKICVVEEEDGSCRLVVATPGAYAPLEIPEGCETQFVGANLVVTPENGRGLSIPVKIDWNRLTEESRPGGALAIPGFPSGEIKQGDLSDFYAKMRENAYGTFPDAVRGLSVVAPFVPARKPNYGELKNVVMPDGSPVPLVLVSSLTKKNETVGNKSWKGYKIGCLLPPGAGQKTSRITSNGDTVKTEFFAKEGERTLAYLSVSPAAYNAMWMGFWELSKKSPHLASILGARIEGEPENITLDAKSPWRIALFITGRKESAPDDKGKTKVTDSVEVGIWGPDGLIDEIPLAARGPISETLGETGFKFVNEHFKAAIAPAEDNVPYPVGCPYLRTPEQAEVSEESILALIGTEVAPAAELSTKSEIEAIAKQGKSKSKPKSAFSSAEPEEADAAMDALTF